MTRAMRPNDAPRRREASVAGRTFSAERLAAIARMEENHFWFAGRRALVEHLVKPLLGTDGPLLDVGCGTGAFAASLAARGHAVVGLDRRPEGIASARARLPSDAPRGSAFVLGDAVELPFESQHFAGAFALDVLEHVDDRRVLSEIHRVLAPGGFFLATVPALPALFSRRDELAGHLRRYTRAGFSAVLTAAGFRVESLRYYQCLLLPLVVLSRLFGKKALTTRELEDHPPALVNRAFTLVNRVEARANIGWPLGSSMAAVVMKPS